MREMISVIVPVYNNASYLMECAQSLSQQTFRNFELIFVDDGSQDDSAAICEALCAQDERFRLLRQAHQGVSAARNRGLADAQGEYLFFLDGDDAIHPQLLETLYGLAERTGAAVAQAAFVRMDTEQLRFRLCQPELGMENGGAVYLDSQQALKQFIFGGTLPDNFCTVVGQLVRRQAAQPLRFDEQLQNGEDTKFLYELLVNGADAVILPREWYYYRMHENNASRIRSPAAYQSIYACEKYICEQEIGFGRKDSAAWQEKLTICRILEWYRLSRQAGDEGVQKYLKELAETERGSKSFPLLSLRDRVKFSLAFHCYPLYLPIHQYLSWRWHQEEKRQRKDG